MIKRQNFQNKVISFKDDEEKAKNNTNEDIKKPFPIEFFNKLKEISQ